MNEYEISSNSQCYIHQIIHLSRSIGFTVGDIEQMKDIFLNLQLSNLFRHRLNNKIHSLLSLLNDLYQAQKESMDNVPGEA